MKNFISFFTSILLCIMFSSCGGVSGNPEKDANQMCKELVSAAESNDIEKANNVMDKYYEHYKSAVLADKIIFIQTMSNNPAFENSKVWQEFTETEDFQNSTVTKKLDILYKQTRSEAKELGV